MPRRYCLYLRERYRALAGYAGGIVAVVGLLQLVPLLLLVFYPEEAPLAGGFLLSGIPLIAGGLLCWHRYKPRQAITLSIQEGSVIVMIVWGVATLSGTVPFMTISELNFLQALFESTSGWTTTGLSVVDVAEAPRLILFFRSFIQLVGGAGLAILALSAITGPVGAGLSIAEGHSDQLVPHVRQSINIVLRIYSAYIVFGIIGLYLAGMDWFDAINHAFAALSTGGFSTRPESIGYWDSIVVEAVTIVLMLAGAINFLTAYMFLRGKFRYIQRNSELRLMLFQIAAGVLPLLIFVTFTLYPSLEKSLRVAIFETISALTTTGFTTVAYTDWSDTGWLVLIVLMLIGGGTGSTSGGIKQYRIYVIYKAIRWEFQRTFIPRHAVNEPAIWQGENQRLLSDGQVRKIALFIGLYLTVFVLSAGIMTLYDYPLSDSLFESASTLSTVGLSVGITAPDMPPVLMIAQILAMILGRLEFFAVIVGVMKLIVDIHKMMFIPKQST